MLDAPAIGGQRSAIGSQQWHRFGDGTASYGRRGWERGYAGCGIQHISYTFVSWGGEHYAGGVTRLQMEVTAATTICCRFFGSVCKSENRFDFLAFLGMVESLERGEGATPVLK